MVIVGKTNRNKLANAERSALGEGPDKLPSHKDIDFDAGSQGAGKGRLKGRAKSCEAGGAHSFTEVNRAICFEVSLTMAIFFALLLGLYVGLIGSLRF